MINTKAIFKGSIKSTELKKGRVEAYWTDKEGTKIEKGFWNSIVRLHIEKAWIYNVNLRIYIKSGEIEHVLYEDVIQPFYLFQNEKKLRLN